MSDQANRLKGQPVTLETLKALQAANPSKPARPEPSKVSYHDAMQRAAALSAETQAEENEKREARAKGAAMARLEADVGPRYAPDRATLEGFQVYHKGQEAIIKRLKMLRDQLPEIAKSGQGLVFYGSVGAAKDHLAIAMLYAAAGLHGIKCRWFSGMEIFGASRDRMDTNKTEDSLIEMLAAPQILCISDPLPPVGDLSAWNVQLLYRVLDKRYHLLRPTWATVNVAKPTDLDSALSAPVYDRLRDAAEFFPCFWPSFRREKNAK